MKILKNVKPGTVLWLQALDEYYTVTSVSPRTIYAVMRNNDKDAPYAEITEENEEFFFVTHPDIRDVDLSVAEWTWSDSSDGTQALYADGVLAFVLDLEQDVSVKRIVMARKDSVLVELDERDSMDIHMISLAKSDIRDTLVLVESISGNPLQVLPLGNSVEGTVIITAAYGKFQHVYSWDKDGDFSWMEKGLPEEEVRMYSSNGTLALSFVTKDAASSRVYLFEEMDNRGPYHRKTVSINGKISGIQSDNRRYIIFTEGNNGVYVGLFFLLDVDLHIPEVPTGFNRVVDVDTVGNNLTAVLMDDARHVFRYTAEKPIRKKEKFIR